MHSDFKIRFISESVEKETFEEPVFQSIVYTFKDL